MSSMQDLGDAFSRETGELTARRWKIGIPLYLLFAVIGSGLESRLYPPRGSLLLTMHLTQFVIAAAGWRALRGPVRHPATAWVALICNGSLCLVLALYNAAVHGAMLYVLLTYLAFMMVTAMFIPWGARFQMGLNVVVTAAYALALAGGARPGPVPEWDYIAVAANMVFSALGAHYIDRYRRQLFGQANALRAANHRLEAANQARTELLSGLSHDMRTPVAVIVGYADLMKEDSDVSEALRQPLRSISREARELLHLVDGVLDLAQIEAGRLPFQRSAFELHELIAPLRETTEDQLQACPVRLRWDVPSGLVIDSDAGKIRAIVRNLLSNAVKYTPEGEIHLTAGRRDGGVEIAVADTGVGIAQEHQELIFDPFRQVTPRSGPPPSGSGFGLYMVKLLVTLVGGSVEVQSAAGKGSRFSVRIPPQPPERYGSGPPSQIRT